VTAKQIRWVTELAGRGIRVFPQTKGKTPPRGFTDWPNKATTDIAQIEAWMKEYPNCNFAGVAGKSSGIVVMDVDIKDDELDGMASFKAMTEEFGEIDTFRVRTGSGGQHLYFKYPEGTDVPTVSKMDPYPGIELLSQQHAVTLPGSFYKSGPEYTIIQDGEFATIPDWLLTLAKKYGKSTKQRKPKITETISHAKGEKISGGERHAAALKMTPKIWTSGTCTTASDLLEYLKIWYAKNCEGDPDPGELEEMAEGWVTKNPIPGKQKHPKQADILVQLALETTTALWTTEDGREFCTVTIEAHDENLSLRSTAFRNFLAGIYYERIGEAVGDQAMRDARQTLCGLSMYGESSEKYPSYVRIAPAGEDVIYFDLGRPDWKIIKIEPGQWTVEDQCPVKFVRPPGILPLELPDPDGDLRELQPFINADENATWVLVAAWLINAMRPVYSQPILVVTGEQGSAKTTLCRVLRSIIDPNMAEMRSAPRELRDLSIAARNSWVITVDNLSGMRDWLSDGFCRLSTGGGMSVRRNYTDDEEELFEAIRPCVMNGIGDIITRPDLMDRSLLVHLPAITEDRRIQENDFYSQVKKMRPRILGGLLTCVATALDNIDELDLRQLRGGLPRMADFTVFASAAYSTLEWDPTTLVDVYFDNRRRAHEIILESSPVAAAILKFTLPIEEPATDLLQRIQTNAETKDYAKMKEFPKTPSKLSGALERLSTDFREIGIIITRQRTESKRTIRIERKNDGK
jgi:hypothetical protein